MGIDPTDEKPVFRLRIEPFSHRRFDTSVETIREIHRVKQIYSRGEGALIIAPPGMGKSTIAEAYLNAFGDRRQEAERTVIPVVVVSIPEAPTTERVAEAILRALGDPAAHRGDAFAKTERIHKLLVRCGVELILIDEFHHLFYCQKLPDFRRMIDWLKIFVDQAKVGIVGLGLAEGEHVADAGPQLRRRFLPRYRITPFSLTDEADFNEFRGLLKSFQQQLPIPPDIPLYEANMARRFHVGSFGVLDYVVHILEGAVSVAVGACLDKIDMPSFAAGFRNKVWDSVPERLNPFFPESPLRPLDRAGEIFAPYTHGDGLGSPLARRLGLTSSRKGGKHGS